MAVTSMGSVSVQAVKGWEGSSSPAPGFGETGEVQHPSCCSQELILMICDQKGTSQLCSDLWPHLSCSFLSVRDFLFFQHYNTSRAELCHARDPADKNGRPGNKVF